MTFTTLTFFLFLAATFSVYWSLRTPARQNVFLVFASYFFYSWWDYRFSALLLVSSLVDFIVGIALGKTASPTARKRLLMISVAVNLGMLGFFKYFDFFADNLRTLLESFGWQTNELALQVVLPIGISFYTFQTMSYTIDVYRGRIAPTRDLVAYMGYVSFFPQLVAGPIERAASMLPQFTRARRFDYLRAVDGCRMILWGVLKKQVVAARLGRVVDPVFASIETASGFEVAFATFCFTFQIYCDFSAYSDIALGTARLLGFDLSRNFAYPFFSQSLAELFRRWHITLMTWLRDYVYTPLGGGRKGGARRALNIMITFGLTGLWHGAAWTFVLWGMFMGLVLVIEPLWSDRRANLGPDDVPGGIAVLPSAAVIGRMGLTFAIFTAGAFLFRAESIADVGIGVAKIVDGVLHPCAEDLLSTLWLDKDGRTSLIAITALTTVEWTKRRNLHPLVFPSLPQWQRWAIYSVVLWATIYAAPIWTGPFIYFQF